MLSRQKRYAALVLHTKRYRVEAELTWLLYFSLERATPWEDAALRLRGLSNTKDTVRKLPCVGTIAGFLNWHWGVAGETSLSITGGVFWGIKSMQFAVQKRDKKLKYMAVGKDSRAFWSKQKWCNEVNAMDEGRGKKGVGKTKRRSGTVPSTLSAWPQLILCCIT